MSHCNRQSTCCIITKDEKFINYAKIKPKNIILIKLIFKHARIRYKYDNANFGNWIEVCRGLAEGEKMLLFSKH